MYPTSHQAFIDELVRTRGLTREVVVDEIVAIARDAAIRVLGTRTPISVELSESDQVQVWQVLTVVDVVSDAARELALADAHLIAPDLEASDGLSITIDYTRDPRDAERREKLSALADKLPLPLWAEGLWEALGEALNDYWLRHFPGPVLPKGTLWTLLCEGGGWLVGHAAREGGTTLRFEDAWLRFIRLTPHHGWVDAGLTVVVERDGGTHRWRLPCSGNDSLARRYLDVPTGPDAREGFARVFATLCAEVDAKGIESLSEYTACEHLITAAILPPRPGSLWAWCEEHLPALLGGHRHAFSLAGRDLELAITTVFAVDRSLRGFGSSSVGLTLTDRSTGDAAHAGLPLGGLECAALTRPGPDATTERDLAAMAATWRAWLDVHVVEHLRREPFELVDDFLYAMAGYFPLVDLFAARVEHGAPPPLPVPPFDSDALARAAALVRAPAPETFARARDGIGPERLLGVFEVGPYAIVLADDLRRAFPFAGAFVGLLAPGVDGICEILRVDAWNPSSRAIVDGDAFAFRRLCEWLREALVRSGLDAQITYHGEDDADEDADEDENEDENEDDDAAEPAAPASLMLSEWLRFGLPDVGDRFLVDWRHQWHIAFAGPSIVECFGGIYGMNGDERARIGERDRRIWRAFLHDVIDPRFSA
ncbi:NusA N-terminal domain-containing protein [Polyangium sp. 15x6]|uniref:NusA N-terminal domain-containing protein n=1 Tax=Polyangium sp. 15x6 TaxID=3042687 RepID=UPI00249A54A3|nr:NusA N-terminal domain-containing protein [Polyangium sp. 15x6]MDI3289259.1 NusA N-terminal domain-containing protein [Polyangium sp. 15x6]